MWRLKITKLSLTKNITQCFQVHGVLVAAPDLEHEGECVQPPVRGGGRGRGGDCQDPGLPLHPGRPQARRGGVQVNIQGFYDGISKPHFKPAEIRCEIFAFFHP